jgi:hypothetical protein
MLTSFLSGAQSTLSADDKDALEVLVPDLENDDTQYAYYTHVAELFEISENGNGVLLFCNRALEVARTNHDTQHVWKKVIQCSAELGLFEDAYAALVECPIANM